MSVTTVVDAEFLNNCYQLEPFHGLKHPTETDETYSVSTMGKRSILCFISFQSTVIICVGTKLGSGVTLMSTSADAIDSSSALLMDEEKTAADVTQTLGSDPSIGGGVTKESQLSLTASIPSVTVMSATRTAKDTTESTADILYDQSQQTGTLSAVKAGITVATTATTTSGSGGKGSQELKYE